MWCLVKKQTKIENKVQQQKTQKTKYIQKVLKLPWGPICDFAG